MNRLQHAPEVMAAATADGEIVMMDSDLATYFSVRDVAARIWSLFEEPRTSDEVIAELLAVYDVDVHACRAETLAFIDKLCEKRLLTPAG